MKEKNNKTNTKGNSDMVTSRLSQVNKITVKLPYDIPSGEIFFNEISVALPNVDIITKKTEILVDNIPIVDILGTILKCFAICEEKKINYGVLTSLSGFIKSFKEIKYISFRFMKGKESDEIFEMYKMILNPNNIDESVKLVANIYNIDKLVIKLCDMFPQNIIDDLNKIMMFDGILEDEYLKRKFSIPFTYDEYCSYIEFIFKNNFELFDRYGEEVFNYLFLFPNIYSEQKPEITLITNYGSI